MNTLKINGFSIIGIMDLEEKREDKIGGRRGHSGGFLQSEKARAYIQKPPKVSNKTNSNRTPRNIVIIYLNE